MTDKNSISTDKFILIHFIGGILLVILIPAVIVPKNSVWLYVYIGSILAFEVYMTCTYRRNWFNVLVNLIIPLELIVLFSYYDRNIQLTVILCIVWIVFSGSYDYLVIRSGKHRNGRRRVSAGKIRWTLLGGRTIFSAVMTIAVLSLCVFYRVPPIPTQVYYDDLQYSVDNCKASLSRLSISTFRDLSREEKLDVLRNICRVEFTALGVDHGFSVECKELNDNYLAQYSESNYAITINEKNIDRYTSFDLLRAMCHECYHAYQHNLLRGDDSLGQYTDDEYKEMIALYTEELSHYYFPEMDLEKYKAQRFERDADAYADIVCVKYLRFYQLSDKQIEKICQQLETDRRE